MPTRFQEQDHHILVRIIHFLYYMWYTYVLLCSEYIPVGEEIKNKRKEISSFLCNSFLIVGLNFISSPEPRFKSFFECIVSNDEHNRLY